MYSTNAYLLYIPHTVNLFLHKFYYLKELGVIGVRILYAPASSKKKKKEKESSNSKTSI